MEERSQSRHGKEGAASLALYPGLSQHRKCQQWNSEMRVPGLVPQVMSAPVE